MKPYAVLLSFSLCFCALFSLSPKAADAPRADCVTFDIEAAVSRANRSLSVSAESAVLIEAESGEALYEKNADKRLPMASLTKIMTALVALERGDLTEEIAVPAQAVGTEGSSLYLRQGERMSLRDLLYGLMLSSANDAAVTIALSIGGSLEGFAALMNEKAEELGLRDTHFVTPHGLDAEEHYTTARDFARLSAAALQNPLFRTIVSAKTRTVEGDVPAHTRTLVNHNKMLRIYPGAIGVKTGYTKKCGRCLVSAAERNGMTLIAVTLNAPDDWNDHTRLLDYGFASFRKIELCRSGQIAAAVPTVSGERVEFRFAASLSALVPRDCPEPVIGLSLPRFLWRKESEIPFCAVFSFGDRTVGKVRLLP